MTDVRPQDTDRPATPCAKFHNEMSRRRRGPGYTETRPSRLQLVAMLATATSLQLCGQTGGTAHVRAQGQRGKEGGQGLTLRTYTNMGLAGPAANTVVLPTSAFAITAHGGESPLASPAPSTHLPVPVPVLPPPQTWSPADSLPPCACTSMRQTQALSERAWFRDKLAERFKKNHFLVWCALVLLHPACHLPLRH